MSELFNERFAIDYPTVAAHFDTVPPEHLTIHRALCSAVWLFLLTPPDTTNAPRFLAFLVTDICTACNLNLDDTHLWCEQLIDAIDFDVQEARRRRANATIN